LTTAFFFFESSKDFRAGLEDKDMLGRYQQAEEYLKKAKETHKEIMVRSTA
jgi:phosphate-selective porin